MAKKAILLLLAATSAHVCGQALPRDAEHCKHTEGAKFNVDSSLGEWFFYSIGPPPLMRYNFIKKTPEEIAEYRNQYTNTTLDIGNVDWSRVTLYCEFDDKEKRETYLIEILNEDGLVRFIPIDESLQDQSRFPSVVYVYIQSIRGTLQIYLCRSGIYTELYRRADLERDTRCRGFAVNATFNPNTSLGEWVSTEDPSSRFTLTKKTPDEIAPYIRELAGTRIANMSIEWEKINLVGSFTLINSPQEPITFLIELLDNSGAARVIPTGITPELSRGSKYVFDYHFKNVGDILEVKACIQIRIHSSYRRVGSA